MNTDDLYREAAAYARRMHDHEFAAALEKHAFQHMVRRLGVPDSIFKAYTMDEGKTIGAGAYSADTAAAKLQGLQLDPLPQVSEQESLRRLHAADAAVSRHAIANQVLGAAYGQAKPPAPQRQPALTPIATADQEAWLVQAIKTAIRLSSALESAQVTRPDDHALAAGKAGIVDGTAREILEMLGFAPSFTNIRKVKP